MRVSTGRAGLTETVSDLSDRADRPSVADAPPGREPVSPTPGRLRAGRADREITNGTPAGVILPRRSMASRFGRGRATVATGSSAHAGEAGR
jgi:hypothetical protein